MRSRRTLRDSNASTGRRVCVALLLITIVIACSRVGSNCPMNAVVARPLPGPSHAKLGSSVRSASTVLT
eukprot:scaffold45589_cov67-Phaeocystis_antarctica.AAC.1